MNKSSDLSEQRALVIGASGLDVVGRLEEELHVATSNPARIRTSFGGVARNVAENLARLGQPVSLLSVIGKDRIGDEVLAHTRQAGVDVSNVHTTDKFPTGFYLGVLDVKGHRQFAIDDMRIMEELNESYLAYNQDLFEQASLVFVDANLSTPALATVFELAKKYHVSVCADPTSGTLALRLSPHLRQLKLITPNSVEAGILAGQPFDAFDSGAALEAARYLVNQGVEMVFVTLAEFGVCYATSETTGHIPAIHTSIVDPTGVGDALTAAVLFALMNDIDLDDAARLGVSAASLTLRHLGTVSPELTLERLYDELAL
jgi:pseudouridine kinase